MIRSDLVKVSNGSSFAEIDYCRGPAAGHVPGAERGGSRLSDSETCNFGLNTKHRDCPDSDSVRLLQCRPPRPRPGSLIGQ
eukprot:239390-Hanusia_phi.AAC.2